MGLASGWTLLCLRMQASGSTPTSSSVSMRLSAPLFRGVARASAPRGVRPWRADHIPASTPVSPAPRTSTARRPSLSPLLSWTGAPRTIRLESSAASLPASSQAPESRLDRDQVPAYELTFTCNVCKTRSSHRLSKQGYHHGTVLISCPDCKNRHLISDHLKAS